MNPFTPFDNNDFPWSGAKGRALCELVHQVEMEEENTTIDGLPNDLLTYVMVNLGQALLIGAVASVCRRWAARMPHVVVDVAGRDGITLSGDQCTVQLLGVLQYDLKKSSVLLQHITSNPLDRIQLEGRQRRILSRKYTNARLTSLEHWGRLNWRVKRVHLERLLAHLEFMCAREKTVVFRILCNLDSESLSPHKTLIASYVPWRHHDSPSPLGRGRNTDFQAYVVIALITIDGAIQEHFTDILDWMKTPSASFHRVGANVIRDMYNVLNEEQLDQFMDAFLPVAFRQSNPPLLRSSALSMLSKVHITKIALYASDMIDMFSVLPKLDLQAYTQIASLLPRLNENTLKPHLLDIINKLSARKHGFVFWELLDKFDSATLSQYDAILRVAAEENDLGPTAHRVLAKLNPST